MNSVPFGGVPSELFEEFRIGEAFLRPFGSQARDLDVELDRSSYLSSLEGLLGVCLHDRSGQEAGPLFVEQLPVGSVLYAALLLLKARGKSCSLVEHCDSCGEEIECHLPLEDLLRVAQAAPWQSRIAVPSGNRVITVRLPTPADLRHWPVEGRSDSDLISALCEESSIDEGDARVIEKALSDADPLVDCDVQIACSCGATQPGGLPLERVAVRCFMEDRRNLLRSIHRLARAYHWSEREIMALPTTRRAAYLHMLEEEVS